MASTFIFLIFSLILILFPFQNQMKFADANCCCCCCPSCCCKPIIIKLPPPPVKLCPCCCDINIINFSCCCKPIIIKLPPPPVKLCPCCCGPCCCGCGGGGGYGRKRRSVVDLMAKKFSDILLPQFNHDAFVPMGCVQPTFAPLQSLCAKIPPIQRGPACQQIISQQPQFPLSQNIFNQQQQLIGGGGTMLNGGGSDPFGNNNGEMTECLCSGSCNNNNNGQTPLMNSQSQQVGGNGCNQQQCGSTFADAINCQQQQTILGGGQSNGCNNAACQQSINGACIGDSNNNNNVYNTFGGVMMDSAGGNNNIQSIEKSASFMHSPSQNNIALSGSLSPCSGNSKENIERGIGRIGRGLRENYLNLGESSFLDSGRKKRFLLLLNKKNLNEELNDKSIEKSIVYNKSEAKRDANKNQQNQSLVFRNNLEFVVRQSPMQK
ncbi:hypothetical protein Mgra_00009060 [Meloidogyne graminicola]|uniref:Uncharacterized protein n=1 Tax=Meloidogyne graminicola TaxID=189291 RepID=A0A8S9ZE01_9BILA|nr:hypothetical protein Mgra_00009060 [Meloidogyne graminicola]